MKVLKVLGILLLFVAIAVIGYGFYVKSSLTPSYAGELQLGGLDSDSEVYFTEFGIPHIYSQSEADAYRTLGYLHAMERLWQMDLLRHVGSGRLSELFGPDMIQNDKYLRTMGLSSYAKESATQYLQRNHRTLPLVQSYVDGINSYIENNPKPLEHRILGVEVEPFEIQNILETLTYMAFSFSNAQITDPVLTELSQKLDSTYLNDLKIYHYEGESTLRSFDDRYSKQAQATLTLLKEMKAPEFIGSNSWVLSPSKTESGKVILANDPHIGFAQPSVWYESHLHFPGGEYYGYHIPGAPFPLLMHSERQAIGITMFENDDMDFYIEEIHSEDSNLYRHDNEWKEIQTVKEIIKVKGQDPVEFTIRHTIHGPVVSDILKEEPLDDVVSMHWVTSSHTNYMIESIYGFIDAESISDVEKAGSTIHGPGLNIMYGDTEGNVAWWAVGKLIKRQNEQTSKTFYDGSKKNNDPDSSYSFAKNPHAINPPWGYVHSANNQPDTVDGVLYSGYYLPDDRGERIAEILNNKEKNSIDDMKSMLLDNTSKMHQATKSILLEAVKNDERSKLIEDLSSWDSNLNKDDFRPLIFQKWIHQIVKSATKDEIGDDLWGMYKSTHTYKVSTEHLILNEDSPWWDNINTAELETREQIIKAAFDTTMYQLVSEWGDGYREWKWGNAHSLIHKHAMGDVLDFLNVGTYPVSGGNEVLNNMGYTYEDGPTQTIRFGPSTRRIVDFSDVRNNSWSIIPTGQSGNYFSPYYKDQAALFANGEFRKMQMNHSIIKESKNKIVFQPSN
ncbi:MAG: penicillin acylase family protein [Ekhidna sp.]|nr:penicillin acylase family protein [Ekhidna sp.]